MHYSTLLPLALLPLTQAETILGVYVFHRHGDRTTKAWAPAKLTDLGYTQVFAAGDYFRNKYITSSSPIYAVAQDVVKLSQLDVEAPVDTVLQNSAQAFLQGLYPPVGTNMATTLANGTKISAPMNGYQLIPVNAVSSVSGKNSENTAWLQGISGCANAIVSSNNYFVSEDYKDMLAKTKDFYQTLNPVINGTFNADYNTFKNAYSGISLPLPFFILPDKPRLTISVYDLINVATINNLTIQSSELLTPSTLFQLRTLADHHEFNLAYNSSESIRAIAGSTLAAQILEHLNNTIATKSSAKFGIQFGAYASFLSFFGLAQLPAATENFTAVVDYASSMTFELVTDAAVSADSFPAPEDISVRFLFSNGSAAYHPQTAYPLFGQKETKLPYNTFVAEMEKFSVGDQKTWCVACGDTTGTCAAYAPSSDSGTAATATTTEGNGMSLPVAGVIGAMVTLAVILGLEALILMLGGLRVVSKKALGGVAAASTVVAEEKGVKA
jgi:hypothetical protein